MPVARPAPSPEESGTLPPPREARRRVVQLMVFRVALITFVLGTTVTINLAAPERLAAPNSVWLFGIIGATYLLSLAYALLLRRVRDAARFATWQFAGDLVVTTALVHLTGGAQSGYTFFYLMSIVGAALVHYQRGAMLAAIGSLVLFTVVAVSGWLHWLPVPADQRPLPWTLPVSNLLSQLAINGAAIIAVAFLASRLGLQITQAGVQLASEEQRSAALAAYSDDVIRCLSSGLVTIDSASTIRTFNGAAAEITGVASRDALGQPLASVLPTLAELLGKSGVDGELRREVITHVRDGGERIFGVSGSPLTNPRGEHVGYIVNFQDLTDLRRMENQIKRGERLAAVGQMAAGVAHEIRNPLASISGSIELLKMTPQLDADSTALMEIVLREVDRLNGLISEMLDYARPRERVAVEMEPAVLLEETVRVFSADRTHAGVTCTLEVEPSAKDLELMADPAQIRQVVWNLLRNAAESMPDGGPIQVTLRVVDADQRWAEIVVADRGRGMTVGELDRLFEPFFTTKSRGTGLGLATVHRIVSEHGGEIVVESEPGVGTRMGVRLPLVDPGTPRVPTYTPAMITTERSGPATGPVAPWKGPVP